MFRLIKSLLTKCCIRVGLSCISMFFLENVHKQLYIYSVGTVSNLARDKVFEKVERLSISSS